MPVKLVRSWSLYNRFRCRRVRRGRFWFGLEIITSIGGFHFLFQARTALDKWIHDVALAISAKPGILVLTEHAGRWRNLLNVKAGDGFLGVKRYRSFVGKYMPASGAGERFPRPLETVVTWLALEPRFLPAGRA